MKNKSAHILELDKVLKYLSEHAISNLGVQRCLNACIFDDVNTIKKELLITSQARQIINLALNVPLDNIFDIEKSIEDAQKKLRLDEEEIKDGESPGSPYRPTLGTVVISPPLCGIFHFLVVF